MSHKHFISSRQKRRNNVAYTTPGNIEDDIKKCCYVGYTPKMLFRMLTSISCKSDRKNIKEYAKKIYDAARILKIIPELILVEDDSDIIRIKNIRKWFPEDFPDGTNIIPVNLEIYPSIGQHYYVSYDSNEGKFVYDWICSCELYNCWPRQMDRDRSNICLVCRDRHNKGKYAVKRIPYYEFHNNIRHNGCYHQ
jgi:hypothetical protein